jgi:hypothetical protein
VNEDEFANWLEDHGFAEKFRGYGHATGTEIAYALYRQGYCTEKEED